MLGSEAVAVTFASRLYGSMAWLMAGEELLYYLPSHDLRITDN